MTPYYNIILRKLGFGKASEWGVAIRKTNGLQTILSHHDKDQVTFSVIDNTEDYWFADPLLFSEGNKTWLFVEAFSRERRKGEIGVFDIKNGEALDFRIIISTDNHMSYPFVFKYGGGYYMIPETGAANEIVLYRAELFPNKWIRDSVLLKGAAYRDSTVYTDVSGKLKLLTYRQKGTRRYNVKYFLEEYSYDMESRSLVKEAECFDKRMMNRPAGFVLVDKGHYYRLGQKCSRVYGESIFVYLMKEGRLLATDTPINELRGGHVRLDREGKVILLHTYSHAGGYEVIDYRYEV